MGPSIPRYLYEARIKERAEQQPAARLADSAKWVSLTAPITLVWPPTVWFHFVTPDPAWVPPPSEEGIPAGFGSAIWAYGEKPIVSLIDVFCSRRTYWEARPDAEGVMNYTSNDDLIMNDKMFAIYCETDWKEHVNQYVAKVRGD